MSEVENAAAMVVRAMRALDAHRHETAPTLEREYRVALETYFLAAERAAGRDQTEVEAAEEARDEDPLEESRAWDLRSDRESNRGALCRRAPRAPPRAGLWERTWLEREARAGVRRDGAAASGGDPGNPLADAACRGAASPPRAGKDSARGRRATNRPKRLTARDRTRFSAALEPSRLAVSPGGTRACPTTSSSLAPESPERSCPASSSSPSPSSASSSSSPAEAIEDYKVGESTVEVSSSYMIRRLGLSTYLYQHQLLKNGLRFFFDSPEKESPAHGDERDRLRPLPVPPQLPAGARLARARPRPDEPRARYPDRARGEGDRSDDRSRQARTRWSGSAEGSGTKRRPAGCATRPGAGTCFSASSGTRSRRRSASTRPRPGGATATLRGSTQ